MEVGDDITVGFEIDGNYMLLESEEACGFLKQTTSKLEWNYSEEMLDAVAVFRLVVDKY